MWRFSVISFFASLAILLLSTACYAGTSANIPVGSTIYRDLEYLESKGLLESAMLSTKPFGRAEAARLLEEAEERLRTLTERRSGGMSRAHAIIRKLKRELRDELENGCGTSIKPVERAYTKFIYSNGKAYFTDINNVGDTLSKGSNFRAGFALRTEFGETLAFYFNPEYRLDDIESDWQFVHAYAKAGISWLELQAGRDSMWWGAGNHGNLLVTDNAKPFDMLKVTTSRPVTLPWIFDRLGLFRPTVFLTRLEEERDLPNANLLGMRLDFKPTPSLQFGLSRVFMFGGRGTRSLNFSDWVKVFTASDSAEHAASPIDGNQIASIDASYVYINERPYLPFSGMKAYTEWGAEDSSGKTKTPSGRANIYGLLLDEPLWLRDVDLRVEWANTARSARYGPQWYTHWKYKTGYTYEGRVIGHHMGSDAQDLFMRAQYRFGPGALAGIEFDKERSKVHSAMSKKKWYGADIEYPVSSELTLSGGLGMERTDTPRSGKSTNSISWLKVNYIF